MANQTQPRTKLRTWQPAELSGLELTEGHFTRATKPRREYHPRYILTLSKGTTGEIFYRGAYRKIPDDVFINVQAGESTAANLDGDYRAWMFQVTPRAMRRTVRELGGDPKALPFLDTFVNDTPVKEVFERLVRSLHQPTSSLTQQTLALEAFKRLLEHSSDADDLGCLPGEEPRAVKEVKRYLHAHFSRKVSLDDLTALTGLSRSYLNESFKQAVGVPPYAYHLYVRLEHAKGLLRRNVSITQVALRTGFADQAHFSKVFKRHVFVTPKQYGRACAVSEPRIWTL